MLLRLKASLRPLSPAQHLQEMASPPSASSDRLEPEESAGLLRPPEKSTLWMCRRRRRRQILLKWRHRSARGFLSTRPPRSCESGGRTDAGEPKAATRAGKSPSIGSVAAERGGRVTRNDAERTQSCRVFHGFERSERFWHVVLVT